MADETDDTGTDETEVEETEEDEDYTPPTKAELEAERAKAKAAITKLNAEAKKHREAAAAAKAKTGAKDDDALKAATESATKANANAVRAGAKSELLAAGLQLDPDADKGKRQLAAILRTIDLSTVSVDDEGDLVGFDVDEIKELFPERFEIKPAKTKTTRINGAGGKPAVEQLTSAQRIAQQVGGK